MNSDTEQHRKRCRPTREISMQMVHQSNLAERKGDAIATMASVTTRLTQNVTFNQALVWFF
jgi:hypothetical protein